MKNNRGNKKSNRAMRKLISFEEEERLKRE